MMLSEEESRQDISLNGAQIASMVEIVSQVAAGMLPRESGINMLIASFQISQAQAEKIMGEAGRSFVPTEATSSSSGESYGSSG